MLRARLAVLVILLSASPFTAPFQPCDLLGPAADNLPVMPASPAFSRTLDVAPPTLTPADTRVFALIRTVTIVEAGVRRIVAYDKLAITFLPHPATSTRIQRV